ncbi:MAG: lipopolysaccharide biosynthesis protein [Devosia sp.]|uniref:lipopolysaccharide biosynthesis protein n=1 Tax=Devosia sp. TaxID=1871048 RepID=UPI001A4EAEBE|nr:lipopolysaccharide biosynthesis protein [Devosia sp.]MBL8597820.1 lipopolysaccharide biosynthesis protein [Devosia sp.]
MSLRQRLLSQSTVIFGARLFGAGLTFLVQVAIARFLGSQALGEYILVMATVNVIAVVMPLGFEATGTYFAAEYRAKGEGRLLRGFMARAYLHIALTGALVIVIGQPVARLFGEAGAAIASHWTPAAVLTISTAMVFVSAAMLVGLKRPFAGFFAETLFRPLLAIAGFVVAIAFSTGVDGINQILWVLSLGYAIVALVQLGLLLRAARDIPAGEGITAPEVRRWWYFAVPWVALVVAGDFFFDIDLLLLAGHMPHEQLAVFGVCTRIFSLVAFGVSAVYAVTMPDMFESEALKDRDGFHRKIGDANLVASGLAVVLLVAVLLLSPVAFMLFGPDFQQGVVPLAILCVGLVVRSVFGPSQIVLSIHNRPYTALPAVAASLASLVVANLALVPPFGLVGAALAALIAMTVWSGALWFTALRVAGVDVSIRARLRPAPALSAKPAE